MSDEQKGRTVTTGLGLGSLVTAAASLAGAATGGPEVVALAREFGFPTALLLFGVLVVLAVCRYVASKVVEPIVSHTTTFVRTATEETRKQTATLECMRAEASEDRKTAAQDRQSAAEDRKTHRLTFEELREELRRGRSPQN